jgi:hypothetical protein
MEVIFMLLWQLEDYITTLLLIIRAKFKNWKLANSLELEKYYYGDNKKQYLLWYIYYGITLKLK